MSILNITNKKVLAVTIIFLALAAVIFLAEPAFAAGIKVNAGLSSQSETELGTAIKDIVVKIGSLIGAIAICALIFNGFRLGTASNEQKRAEALNGIKWALIAVIIVGLAVMSVSFVASIVSGS